MNQLKPCKSKTSTFFDLDFANDNILSYFLYFNLITELYYLIPIIITQFFNSIAELVIPIEIPTKEATAATEMHAPTV